MISTNTHYPKLRNIEVRPVMQSGRASLLLRDPLQLTDKLLIVPEALAPILALCDGTRENASAISATLAARFGVDVPADAIQQILDALDEVRLLDNDTYHAVLAETLAEYRAAPFRPPINAGQTYPAQAEELRELLNGYLAAVEGPSEGAAAALGPGIYGLISPHIDYHRGGPVYARVWKRAAEIARAADLVIILGTDHYGGEDAITLTRQNYATPYGVLPTPRAIVDTLAQAIGEERALAGELRHRSEHSIELAAVWLHHMRDGKPCDLVPILCGSFFPFMDESADPDRDPRLGALLGALKPLTEGRRVLIVAAGDLSHVGPAFGGDPVDFVARGNLNVADDELMGQLREGDAAGFLEAIRRVRDRNNVCGLPPIYLTLRLLGPVQGERVAYDHCPADDESTSWVSVCGIVYDGAKSTGT